MKRPILVVLFAFLAGCDAGGLLGPEERLHSGLYTYDTWSDRGGHAWWGYLDLRVDFDGRITGSYRLPGQCSDGFGFAVDCVGRVGGRVYSDGTLRFGLDEGWLRHEGRVYPRSEVEGVWETRLLGYLDSGEFQLLPY